MNPMIYVNLATAWVKARFAERTSWDGGVLIAVSLLVILASPILKWAAYAGLAWGAYTLLKGELDK
jgi:hypothetical protein